MFRARPATELGGPAPAFSLESVTDPGTRVRLADLRGRPVVLNFWASWCEPCKQEAPELERERARFEGRVAFLGVSILDGADEARAFVDRYDIGYPSVRDPGGVVSKRYGVTGVPETVFVDAEGRIAGKFVGAFEGQLEGFLDDLVLLRPGGTLRITGRGETRPVP